MIQITSIDGENKERLYVFFSSRKLEGFDTDQFHWLPLAKKLNSPAYLIRDTSNDFYRGQHAIMMLQLLKSVVEQHETIFVGSSMGAYGAILWGQQLKPSKVVAFTPSPPEKDKLHETAGFPPIDIHVCRDSHCRVTNEYTDLENAELYRQHANITFHDGDKHNCAGVLRDSGKLIGIIKDALK